MNNKLQIKSMRQQLQSQKISNSPSPSLSPSQLPLSFSQPSATLLTPSHVSITKPQINPIQHQFSMQPQQSEPQSATINNTKKSPVKYSYLSTKLQQQRQRQWNVTWLECLAMFIFIYASTCEKENTGVDLSFFVGIMMAIPICARQTGANLNPAVSYAMTFKPGQNKTTYLVLLWLYIKAQIFGAILSMIIAIALNDVYRQPLYPPLGYPIVGQPQYIAIYRIILSEAIGVFILIFLILYGTGPYSFITNTGAKYFYISIFVYIGRKFAAMSGNQINLALTISQAFVGFWTCDFQGWKYLLCWVLGDLFGVLIAVGFYMRVVQPTLQFLEKSRTLKVMSVLKQKNQRQLTEIHNSKIKVNNQKKQQENVSYYKKLQYY